MVAFLVVLASLWKPQELILGAGRPTAFSREESSVQLHRAALRGALLTFTAQAGWVSYSVWPPTGLLEATLSLTVALDQETTLIGSWL